jgi:hypothetical protein
MALERVYLHFQNARDDRSSLRARQNQYFLPPDQPSRGTKTARAVTAAIMRRAYSSAGSRGFVTRLYSAKLS